MRLQNQVAIITGGSQGIGQAICKAFAQEGATVIIVNHNHPQRAKETELKIQQAGGKAQAISCNLLDPAAIKNLMEAVKEKYKKVDILVNNAGVVIFDKPFEEHTLEDWDYVININLRGNCTPHHA